MNTAGVFSASVAPLTKPSGCPPIRVNPTTIVTSNLPFDEWTGVFGSERLTGALLDRLTHHVHILEMNGASYRLKQSKQRQRQT